MNLIRMTRQYLDWFERLKDRQAIALILSRIDQARQGHFGDWVSVGRGVREMPIHAGPGYRIYFTQIGDVTYLLLCAGRKSTQAPDIRRAQQLADAIRKGKT